MSAIIASMTQVCMVKAHEESNHRGGGDLERRQEAYKLKWGAIQESVYYFTKQKNMQINTAFI